MADLSLFHLKYETIFSLKSKPTSQLQPLTCLTPLTSIYTVQLKYLQTKVRLISHRTIHIQLHHASKSSCWERCLSLPFKLWIWENFEQVLAKSWIIYVNNPWLNHGWLWSPQVCTSQRLFWPCFQLFSVEKLSKVERPSLHPDDFVCWSPV